MCVQSRAPGTRKGLKNTLKKSIFHQKELSYSGGLTENCLQCLKAAMETRAQAEGRTRRKGGRHKYVHLVSDYG